MVTYDTPRQYLAPDRFLIFILVWHHVTFKLKSVPPLANEFYLLRGADWQSHMGIIYYTL